MRRATTFLIAANVLVYLVQRQTGDTLLAHFALWPTGRYYAADLDYSVGFRPWQLITSAFLHGSATHILLNMYALWMFGREVEATLGTKRFVVLYFAAVLTAGLVQLAVVSGTHRLYPTIGASGGVFGLLLAFGALFPRRMVMLLIPPIPMRAWLFVTLYGAVELVFGVTGTVQGVAHFAHLGGMVGAWLALRGVMPKRRRETY